MSDLPGILFMIASVGFSLSCCLGKLMKLAYLNFQEVIQEEKGLKYFYVLVCRRVNFHTLSLLGRQSEYQTSGW